METLLLKLVLTPALIAAASLAARRWGQAVGGWLVGLPLTSGPVAVFIALEQGASFSAAAAIGSLVGTVAQAAFCVAYAHLAMRGRWPVALACGSVAFAAVGVALQRPGLSLIAMALAVVVTLVIALRCLPRAGEGTTPPRPPRWELPARMTIATALVVALTGFAPVLGPRLSGVLATFPIYAAILTVFAHRASAPAAVEVLRGLLLGLFAFAGFFVVLGALIERAGIAAAFGAAIVTAIAIQAGSLAVVLGSAPQQNLQGGNSRE